MEVTGLYALAAGGAFCASARRCGGRRPAANSCCLWMKNAEPQLAERVKQCKKDGLIDAFIYNSTSERYLSALLDSV